MKKTTTQILRHYTFYQHFSTPGMRSLVLIFLLQSGDANRASFLPKCGLYILSNSGNVFLLVQHKPSRLGWIRKHDQAKNPEKSQWEFQDLKMKLLCGPTEIHMNSIFLGRFAPWMNSNSISTYINHFSFIEFRPKKQPLKPPPWHDPLRRAASLCGGAGLCLAEHRSRRVRLGGCKLCLGRKIGVEGGNPYGNPWKSMKIYGDVTWWCMQQRLDFGSFPNLLDKSKW